MTTFTTLSPAQIIASTTNPRKAFNAAKLQELADSIKAQGIHTPIIVRPLPASRLADTVGLKPRPEYELVAGERRLRAARLVLDQGPFAGVPAIVRSLTDAEVLDIQLTENMQRDDLTHLEESDGIQLMIDKLGLTVDQVAAKLGLSRRSVFKRLSLQSLASEVRAARVDGKIDDARAFEISRIPTQAGQLKALKIACQAMGGQDDRPAYSVRELRDWINRQIMLRIDEARFDTNSKHLPSKGCNTPCSSCEKTSRNNADLFDDPDAPNLCLDAACWAAKMEAHQEQQIEAMEKKGFHVITGEQAKGTMPHQWSVSQKHPGYIRAATLFTTENGDPAANEDGEITYAAALGKRIKECDPKAIIHEQLDEPIQIIHQGKADAILVELGYITPEDAEENAEEHTPRQSSEDHEARRQETKRINRARKLLQQAFRQQILALPALSLSVPPSEGEREPLTAAPIIIDALLDQLNIGWDTEDDDTRLIGLNPDLDVADQLATFDEWQKARILLRHMAWNAFIGIEVDEPVLTALGLDVPAARAAAKAAFDAEFNPEQTPQPEPAQSAKQAAKGKSKGKAKASAQEASQGIAQALQQAEQEAQTEPEQKPAAPEPISVGDRVIVAADCPIEKRRGKVGKVTSTAPMVSTTGCWVNFGGRAGSDLIAVENLSKVPA